VVALQGGGGYWFAAADGGVFSFGDAKFLGSASGLSLAAPIVGMARTPSGSGYWLVGSDGGVFSFGDAQFHGSASTLPLRAPVVGMASTPDGGGYWLVASDGGVFSYGDARFYGSAADLALNAPIVGVAPDQAGSGYWLDGSDGGVFAFGSAMFFGASPSVVGTVVGPVFPTPDDGGYWLLHESAVGSYGAGFGDVAPCWGANEEAYAAGTYAPDIVGTAVAGAKQDPNPYCLV
jgi:hypothetical protein